jgi:hypothetical protein
MINFILYDLGGIRVGAYVSLIVPRQGEILDANNGRWKVIEVVHDIRGELSDTSPRPFQTDVALTVTKI